MKKKELMIHVMDVDTNVLKPQLREELKFDLQKMFNELIKGEIINSFGEIYINICGHDYDCKHRCEQCGCCKKHGECMGISCDEENCELVK